MDIHTIRGRYHSQFTDTIYCSQNHLHIDTVYYGRNATADSRPVVCTFNPAIVFDAPRLQTQPVADSELAWICNCPHA